MKFKTKLWRRSEKSFATTIPQALLFLLEPDKKYNVEWIYNPRLKKWIVDFIEVGKKRKAEIRLITKLWKRSQRSYATTIPHAVIVHIEEEKEYELVWTFDSKLEKWVIEVVGK